MLKNKPWKVSEEHSVLRGKKGRMVYIIIDSVGDLLFNTEWSDRTFPDALCKVVNASK